jgi:hypothetical protein
MLNLIPQVFYDFLARIIPGAILIVVTTIIMVGPATAADFLLNSPNSDKLFSIGFILLWALGSYLIGFLLGNLWEMTLEQLTRSSERNIETKCKEKCLTEYNQTQNALKRPGLDIAPDNLPRISIMLDQIRHIKSEEASRLLKLRAERKLCQVLLLGFFILSIVNGMYLVMQLETARIVLEILLIGTIVTCWSGAQKLHRYLANGTTASWLVLISSNKSRIQKNQN